MLIFLKIFLILNETFSFEVSTKPKVQFVMVLPRKEIGIRISIHNLEERFSVIAEAFVVKIMNARDSPTTLALCLMIELVFGKQIFQ